MAYFAAILHMIDAEKNIEVRPQQIEYLNELEGVLKRLSNGTEPKSHAHYLLVVLS